MGPSLSRRLFRASCRAALLLTALLFARPAAAADKIWSYGGVNNLASTAGNWIGGAPGSGDHVIFGSTTPTKMCTWDLGVTVSSVDFSGTFSSTVFLTSDLLVSSSVVSAGTTSGKLDLHGRLVSIGANLIADGLTITSSVAGSSVVFAGASNAVASKAGGSFHFENFISSKDVGSGLAVNANMIVDGGFIVSEGGLTLSGIRLDVAGAFYLGGFLDMQTSTIALTGSAPQVLEGGPGSGGGPGGNPTSLAALYLQNPSTVTVPGLTIGVVIATTPATTVSLVVDTFNIGSLTVAGGSGSNRIMLVSASVGTQTVVNLGAASIDSAYIRDIDASGGVAPFATHSIDGGNNSANWVITPGGGNLVWSGAGANALASNGANWVGGVPPTTDDYVTFGTGGAAKPCTWDLSVQVASVSVNGSYASPVTLANDMRVRLGVRLTASAASLVLAGHAVRDLGDWYAGATSVTGIAGSSVSFEGANAASLGSLTGGPVVLPGISIAKTGAAVTALSGLNVTRDFAMGSGTFVAGAFRDEIGGSLRVTGGTLDVQHSTVAFSGSGVQAASITGGSVTQSAALYVQSGAAMTFTGAWPTDVLVATRPASSIVFATGASPMAIGFLRVNGQALGTWVSLAGPGAFHVLNGSDVEFASVSGLDASSGLTIPALYSLDGGSNVNWSITSFGGAVREWSYGGGSPNASVGANWSGGIAPSTADFVLFGGLTPNSPCTWDLPMHFSSFSISGAYNSVVTLSTGLSVANGIRLDAAGGTLNPAGQLIVDFGDWIARPGALAGSGVLASTVAFGGGAAASIASTGAGPVNFGNVVFTKASTGTLTISSDLLLSGAFDMEDGNTAAGAHRLELGADLRIYGGALDVSRATFVFSGAAPQETLGNGNGSVTAIAGFFVQNPTTMSIADLQADVFVATRPSSTIRFTSPGGGPTIFGSFTVNGQSLGTRVSLIGVNAPTLLRVTGSDSIDFASVQNLDATSGIPLNAAHSLDGGGNSGWTISSVGGAFAIWDKTGANALASNPANWVGGAAPSDGDFVLFGATTPSAPCTWDLTVAVASFSVSGAYASTVTLSSDLTVAGAGVRLDAAAANVDFHGRAMFVTGDWNAGATTLESTIQGSSVVFVGAGDSRVTSLIAAPASFEAFVSSKDPGGRVLPQSDLLVDGDFVIANGTFSAPSRTISLHADLALDGGYLDVRGTTVTFTGLKPQSLTGNGQGQVTKFAGLDVQTVMDVTIPDVAADVLTAVQPNASLVFATQGAPLVLGAMKIDGGSTGSRIRLRSSVPGTPAQLVVLSTASVNFARVADNDASGGVGVIADNSIDDLGNTGWTFRVNGFGIQLGEFSEDFFSSATIRWISNFAPGQTYLAELSTDAFATLVQSSVTANLTATFTGLRRDTLYDARVSTDAAAIFTDAGTTVTLADPPTSPAVAAAFQSSVTLTWNGGANPADTQYVAAASTDSFATLSASSGVYTTSSTISGLLSNATYYLAVLSRNRGGVQSPVSSIVSTVTAVALPAAGAAPFADSGTVVVFWASGGNDAGTWYDSQISTNGFTTLVNSTRTTALTATYAPLTPDTSYQLRVRALSRAGVPTAFVTLSTAPTLLAPPGAASPAFTGVGVSSVAAAWTSGGNVGATYTADLGDGSYANVVFSSVTKNLSALFGTGGAGSALVPNTTYFLRVRAASASNSSAYLLAGSTWTSPADPAAPAASGVETASGAWSWGSGGNSTPTVFAVQLSTDSFSTLVQVAQATGTSALFNGLTPNTTYQFRVRALGFNGVLTPFASAASSSTKPSPPAPGAFSVFISSAHLTWTDPDPPSVLFAAEASSDAFATLTASSVTAGAFADVTGLTPSVAYAFRIRAIGNSGASAAASAGAGTTGTFPPGAPSFTATSTGSAVVAFASGGNPAGVLYDVDLSTDSFVGVVQTSATASLTASFGGLTADTTHQVRVRSRGAGTPSAYVAGAATTTAVDLPGAAAFSGVGSNDVTANWTAGGNGPGTLYEARMTTGTFPVYNASTVTAALAFDFPGLTVNTTYGFEVRAIGRNGTPTSFLSLGTTQTLLLAPGAPVQPFLAVGLSSVSVSWTSGGNGPGIVYEADVSTDGFGTINETSATASLAALFGTGGFGPALTSDATYFFRVRATGGASGSAYVGLGSTATYADVPASPAAVNASTSVLTLTWSAGGNAATTVYEAQSSTDSFGSLVSSSRTAGATAAFRGLQANATYQLRVRALGIEGPTAFVAVSTWTLPAAPVAPSAAAISQTSVTVTWTAPNAAGTPYTATLSTAPPQVYATTTVFAGSAGFTGLLANVTYYASVSAYAPDGTGPAAVSAAATATPVALPPAFAVSGLGVTTGTWTWGIGLNGPTTYQIDVATVPGFAPLWATASPLVSSAAGAGWAFAGLQPNATQYARVRARGITGDSAFAAAAAAATEPAAPAPLSPVSVGTGSIVAAWGAGGNPAGTVYEARVSTDAFATYNASALTTATQAGFGGLAANTAHDFRVRVRGVAADGAFVDLPSTSTLPGGPGAPGQPFSAVGAAGVTVSWTSGGNSAGTVYRADVSSDAFATFVVSSVTANLSVVFGSGGEGTLRPDTTYQFRVAATSGAASSPATALGSTTTFAADPAGPAASASSTGALTLAWGGNGNPADTQYQAQASTDSFASVSRSSAVATTAATISGLTPDTTYQLRVRAVGRGGTVNAYVGAPSTATLAAAPSAPAASLGVTGATLTWSAAGNPATTVYEAQASSDAFVTVFSSGGAGLTASFAGLTPNTTYTLRVRALGLDGATAFATAAASATSPSAPSAPAAAAPNVSSATLSWSANGDPAGTSFGAEISTDPAFATVVQSSVTANLSASFGGLVPNTTYYQRVRALGVAGARSAYAVAAGTSTPAAAPTAAAITGVGAASVTANWGAGGNRAGTAYEAQASSDAFAHVLSSVTANLSATFSGLSAGTAYALQVRALGNGGVATAFTALGSTQTLLGAPGAAGAPFSGLSATGVTVAWTAGGSPAGTNFVADLSTDAFATLVQSSSTFNLSATFAGLTPDTTYNARVQATAGAASSAYLAIGSTATPPAAPAAPAFAVGATTAALSWTGGGNPATTRYRAELSTNAFATLNVSSQVVALSASFSGLVPDTTYYARVRAAGVAGAVSAYAGPVSSATDPAPPSSAVFAPLSSSSGTASWSGGANPSSTLYAATLSSDAFATVAASAAVRAASAGFTGLTPNTTYQLDVRALGANGRAAGDALSALAATFPAAPSGAAAAGTDQTSAALAWSANGNPAGTAYRARVSTDNFATVNASSVTTGVTALFSGLQPNATVQLDVRAEGWAGAVTAYSAVVTTAAAAAVPVSSGPASVATGTVVAAWGSGGNAATTLYEAQVSTDAFGTINAVRLTTALAAAFGGLLSNTSYDFRVRALGRDGTPSAFAALPSTTTILLPPAAGSPSFPAVGGSSVAVAWASGGNGPGTSYRVQLSTDGFASVVIGSDTASFSALFGTGGAGAALPFDTTYQARVLAFNGGNASVYVALGSTATLADDPAGPAASAAATTSLTLSWSAGGNPADTQYQAQLSTDAFASVSKSSAVRAASAAFSALVPDTTYYPRVRAVSRAGAANAYVDAPATATFAAAPAAPAVSFSASAATLTWSAAGNPATTVYEAQLSTDSFASLNDSNAGTAVSAPFPGLTPNTTFFLRVRALGLNGPTAFAAASAGATSPLAPSAPLASAAGTTASLAWTSGDPAGTLYRVQLSTDAFATVAASSVTASLSASFPGLEANATYYLRVRTEGWASFTSFIAAAATVTPVALPVSAPPASVTTGTVTAAWGTGGNAAGTWFEAQISSDAFATLNARALTTAASAAFGGLLSNANYDFRVRALARDGTPTAFTALPSTTTLLLPPAAPAAPFTDVEPSSIAVAWAPGGNGAGTVYRVQLSTDGFATVAVGSDTANLSALFGTGGEGSPLPLDTTYQARVQTVGGGNASVYVVLGSTGTRAAEPGTPAVSSGTATTLTFAWSANGNPADTLYQAQASRDGFATIARSTSVAAATAALTGLTPDTTYALRARAVSRAGAETAYAAVSATATFAAQPLSPAAAYSANAATLTWSAAGNPATTVYEAQLSTDGFATLNASLSGAGTSADFTGLSPNTTYYLRARALGLNGPTFFSAAAPGATVPLAPGAPAASASGTTATLAWTSGDPAGTVYRAQISTDAFVTVNASSATANLSASFAGLLSNATYYLRVRTEGWSSFSAYAVAAATTTPVASPVSAPPAFVSTGSITAAWGDGGNAPGTLYDAQISTDAFASVNATRRAVAVAAAFTGLIPNTGYDFRVRAIGRDGTATAFVALPSTTTLLLPPARAARSFPSVGVSSLTVAWASGGNGSAAVYRVQLSTDAFATVSIASDTRSLSTVFGTGGEGPDLPVNTLYEARVMTFNGPNTSALIPLGSSSTLADAPSGTAIVASSSQTATLDWSASGNPEPGTSYQVQRDVTAAFSSPKTVTVSTSGATLAGLAMGATYYFRVRAVSAAGAPTPFDAAVSTVTLPPAPGRPGTPVATVAGASTLSWGWTPASLASTYALYADTGATVPLGVQASTTFVQGGLGPNASSFLTVVGVNASGQGPRATGLGWTPPNAPSGTALVSVQSTSATLSWSLNGNPSYTTAEIQRSPTGAVYASVATGVTGTSYTDSTLEGCSLYYYRVRNVGGDGQLTSFDTVVAFFTAVSTPLAPTALSARAESGRRVGLTWTPSPSTDVTAYRLYSDGGSGSVDYGTPYAVFTATETSFLTQPLVSSAAYVFALRAYNRCGNEEKNLTTRAASPAAASPAAVSAAVSAPEGGRRVGGDRVTVAAAQTGGALSAVSAVLFQYRPSGIGSWTDVIAAVPAHPNPALSAPFFTQWDVTGLAPGAYDLRAVAYDLSSSSDPAPAATTIAVDPSSPDLVETDIGGGRARSDQTVYASIDNAVVAGGLGAGDPLARLVLPAGALGTSTATLSLISGPDLTGISTAPAGAQAAGLYGRVDLSNAQTVLSAGRTATLTLSYPDANNDGIVDGTGITASNLRFYSYDAVGGAWRKDLTTTFDPAARTVTGATPHFSLFGVFAAASASSSSLDKARVYPVPYKPNGSNPDEGRPYAAGVPGTGIFFDGLPAGARVRIFTADGRLVAELSAGSGTSVQWDARNGEGRDVATGGYFAVIGAPGARSVVRRLSIIR